MDQKLAITLQKQMCAGTWNLLHNCANLQPGEKLLLVCEYPELGWYDQTVFTAVENAVRKFGITPSVFKVGAPDNAVVPGLSDAIAAHDITLYLARLGDQGRFDEIAPGKRSVMCYFRDGDALASSFCQVPYQAIKSLKNAVDEVLINARTIKISCPLGTNLSGITTPGKRMGKSDVSVLRFPLGVPQPITAAHFSGRVALAHFLTPTGSKVYEPASVPLLKTTFARITRGRITGFDGDQIDVKNIRAHYENVATKFGIDRDIVHSWHAGIHPGCAYLSEAAQNPDRWSNTVFGNPRILHFHTCGDYAPAEISWMVIDPTIEIDGCRLWDQGRLCPENFETTTGCFDNWPELNALFKQPSREIGVEF